MHLWLQHQPGSVAQKVRAEDSEEEGERGRGARKTQNKKLQNSTEECEMKGKQPCILIYKSQMR